MIATLVERLDMLGILGFTGSGIAASSKQEQYLREAAEARVLNEAKAASRLAVRTAPLNYQRPGPSRHQADSAVSPLRSSGLQTQSFSSHDELTIPVRPY